MGNFKTDGWGWQHLHPPRINLLSKVDTWCYTQNTYVLLQNKATWKLIKFLPAFFTENTQNRWTHQTPGNDQTNSEWKGVKDSTGYLVNAACGSCLDSDSGKPTRDKHLRQFREFVMEFIWCNKGTVVFFFKACIFCIHTKHRWNFRSALCFNIVQQ